MSISKPGIRAFLAILIISATFVTGFKSAFSQTAPGGMSSSGSSKAENTFIIRDTPQNLQKIEEIIKSLDVAPKQVLIEANIFDITLGDQNSSGIDWSLLMTQAGRKEPLWQFDQTLKLNGGNGALRFGTLSSEHFSILLQGLKGNNRARSLSNPKIAAMNGQSAVISVGQRIPYSTTTTYPANGGNPPYTVRTTQFADVPISLDVTPNIYDDGTIRMKVKPVITAVVSMIPDSAPWTETRQADTEVIVRDGETLILGGLITENKSVNNDSIPILGRIPLLKSFFEKKVKTSKRSELVVFITPKIVESDGYRISGEKFMNQMSMIGKQQQ
ncbi:MAG: type II secretion system protein GspD [Candidatus Riflebacteria bacterium]|nr:type II secretion system protein GspD [Candidatus Riflebacteria bacterium]